MNTPDSDKVVSNTAPVAGQNSGINAEASTKMSHIKDWAIDADPGNDPTYPLQQRDKAEHQTSWNRPVQQPRDHEILRTVERPGGTAVHGTSVPPSGLSGMVRRFAFQYGEGRLRHWLPLILADRINVVEGIFADLRRGRIPNIYTEKGIKAEWQHNRPAVIKKAAVTAVVAAGIVCWLQRGKYRKS
jgi:hypothetical protein